MIIYITKSYLEFFGEDFRKLVLNFERETLEKLDDFKDLVAKYSSENAIKKQSAAIILAPDLYLEKDFALVDEEALDKEVESYYKDLKVDPATILEKRLKDEEKIYLISVKEELIKNLKEAFSLIGWDIISIAPATIFRVELEDGKINSSEAAKIGSSKQALESANFLSNSTVPLSEILPEYEENKKSPGMGNLPLFLVILALTITAETSFLVFFKPRSLAVLSLSTFAPSPTPTMVPTNTPSPTPSITKIKKEDVKISALNGTGVAGQAKQVKDALTSAGYTNIETGNGDNKEGSTTITFYTNIPSALREDIEDVIKKSYKNVIIQEDIKANDFDVVILTGN